MWEIPLLIRGSHGNSTHASNALNYTSQKGNASRFLTPLKSCNEKEEKIERKKVAKIHDLDKISTESIAFKTRRPFSQGATACFPKPALEARLVPSEQV